MAWWQWHRHPLVLLAVVSAAACYCAVVLHPRALVVAVVALAVALLGLCLPWLMLARLRGELLFGQQRGEVGKPLRMRVRLSSGWWWPIYGLIVRPGWSDHPAESDDSALAIALVPNAITSVGWEAIPDKRGEYPQGNATARTAFPFGFLWATRRIDTRGRAIIWPEIVELIPWTPPHGRRAMGQSFGAARSGSLGEPTGARPYQPGDPLRRIHWPLTARHNRLIVCERSDTTCGEMEIVLETDPEVHVQSEGGDSLETAIRAAASMASAMAGQRLSVVLAFNDRQLVEADGEASLCALLDALALHTQERAASLEKLTERIDRRRAGDSWRVVISTDKGIARLSSEQLNRERQLTFVIEDRQGEALAEPLAPRAPLAFDLPIEDPAGEQLQQVWKEAVHAY